MRSLCLLLISVCSVPAVSLDREAFSFIHYDLEARIEPAQQRLGVRGKITLRNDSGTAQKNAVLQISSSLNWLSIQLDGKPAQFFSQTYTSDIDHTGALGEAVVALPKPVEPKKTITIEVGYEGTIPQDATRLTRIGAPAEDAKHSDWDQISSSFTGVRGIGYVAWYPIATQAASLAEGNDVVETAGRWKQRETGAELRVRFSLLGDTRESASSVICGDDRPPQKHSGETSECVFRSLDSEVPFFVSGDLQRLERTGGRILYLSDHQSQAQDYSLAMDEATEFIAKWLPADRNASTEIVELPDGKAAPFETGSVLLTPFSGNASSYLLSAIAVLSRANVPSPRAWIREGFARFAQAAFIEDREGRDAAIEYLRSHRQTLLQGEKSVPANQQAAHSVINSGDDFYVQTKSMNVWWMLRDLVGEAALKAALHNYKSEDDNSAQYMQKLIEAQGHKDLEWFFDDWVYRDHGLPDLRIASVYPRELVNGGYMVTVTVENRGSAGAEIPVTLRMANGENTERLRVPAKATASVRIVCPSFPRQAIVNDGSVAEADEKGNVYKIEQVSH
jgi:hypothetical protein